jgi:hypothetical protein
MQMYLAMTEWNEAAFMALVSGPLWQFLLGSESSDPIALHASQTTFSVRLCVKLRASPRVCQNLFGKYRDLATR